MILCAPFDALDSWNRYHKIDELIHLATLNLPELYFELVFLSAEHFFRKKFFNRISTIILHSYFNHQRTELGPSVNKTIKQQITSFIFVNNAVPKSLFFVSEERAKDSN